MKKLVISSFLVLATIVAGAQAEFPLDKGCATKKMIERYNSKAQIAGSRMDGSIVVAGNFMLGKEADMAVFLNMEAGVQYDVAIILDREKKNKLYPHSFVWGTAYRDKEEWQTFGRSEGPDVFYTLPIAKKNQQIELDFMGTVYYDLRDADEQHNVCAIVYVVRRYKQEMPSFQANEKPTVVPAIKPENKTEVFDSWSKAKSLFNWQWLEISNDASISKSFSGENYLVAQKGKGFFWSQALMPYSPFPAYWNYKAAFNMLKDSDPKAENGLMLTATYGEETYKILFLINPTDQTYYIGQFNTNTKTWLNLYKGDERPMSKAIRKLEPGKEFTYNNLNLYRDGKTVSFYVNNEVVATFNTGEWGLFNYMTGVGVAGHGIQAYTVKNIEFWKID